MTTKQAFTWSALWFASAIGFSLMLPNPDALTFLSCYMTEKLLSFDNLFMFYVIFEYFRLNAETQAKALTYGIIGAVVFRAIMIFTGTNLIHAIPLLMYGFGGFLAWSGYKILMNLGQDDEENKAPEGTINFLFKHWPEGVTTFWLTIATIEITDVVFALDSIPASFGITSNPWLIYSANIFAILGLRSLYFVMLNMIKQFHYMQHAVGTILSFIGFKMILAHVIPISSGFTFMFIITTMLTACGLSWAKEVKYYDQE